MKGKALIPVESGYCVELCLRFFDPTPYELQCTTDLRFRTIEVRLIVRPLIIGGTLFSIVDMIEESE